METLLAERPGIADIVPNMALRSMPGIMVVDHTGTIRSSNQQAAGLFGGCPDKLIGRSIASLIPDIPYNQNSPGFNARSIAHLSQNTGWRESKGVDLRGRAFRLRFDLSRMNDGDNPGNSICYHVKLLDVGGRA